MMTKCVPIDRESAPGHWLPTAHMAPVTRRKLRRRLWEEEYGPLPESVTLRRNCPFSECVNPDCLVYRDEEAVDERIIELRRHGRTLMQICAEVGVRHKRVVRVLQPVGLHHLKEPTWPPGAYERAVLLLKEGLPVRWVAEDVQVGWTTVQKLRERLGIVDKDWVRTQLSVRKSKHLAPLHELFNP